MHEIKDEEIGKAKFVSVAEARGKFKELLEIDDNVVVTRYNTPLKIIIGYNEFRKIMQKLKTLKI